MITPVPLEWVIYQQAVFFFRIVEVTTVNFLRVQEILILHLLYL